MVLSHFKCRKTTFTSRRMLESNSNVCNCTYGSCLSQLTASTGALSVGNHQWNYHKHNMRRKAGKFTQQSERTWCLKQQGRWAEPSVANQQSGNMEKSDIPVKEKLMTTWNVPSNPGFSACLSHRLKIPGATDSDEAPVVFTTETILLHLWIIQLFTYLECTQRTKCNKRISPWVCWGPDGRACGLLYLVTSTQTDSEHLYCWQVQLKPL